jgi:hypothetical protein
MQQLLALMAARRACVQLPHQAYGHERGPLPLAHLLEHAAAVRANGLRAAVGVQFVHVRLYGRGTWLSLPRPRRCAEASAWRTAARVVPSGPPPHGPALAPALQSRSPRAGSASGCSGLSRRRAPPCPTRRSPARCAHIHTGMQSCSGRTTDTHARRRATPLTHKGACACRRRHEPARWRSRSLTAAATERRRTCHT